MNQFKIIAILSAIILSSTIEAQEKNAATESEIVMTKAELESFLNKIADAKRTQLAKKKEKEKARILADLRQKYDRKLKESRNQLNDNQTISKREILNELDRIHRRIDLLNSQNYSLPTSRGNGDKSTIILPNGNSPAFIPQPSRNTVEYTPQPSQDANLQQEFLANERRMQDLQRELDTLRNQQNLLRNLSEKPNASNDSLQIALLKNQILRMQSQINQSQQPQENRRMMLSELLAKYKNFKKQVFFANNSSDLNANDYSYLQEIKSILTQYPELSVVLEGWASAKGNAQYNKKLSMKRAESVEQALNELGISSHRIVSSFRGEDTSTSEQMARRVDISIILK